jgi:hypothetical protein
MWGFSKERKRGVDIYVGTGEQSQSKGTRIMPIPQDGSERGILFTRTKEYEVVGQTVKADGQLDQETIVVGRFRNGRAAIEAARDVLRERRNTGN